MELKARVGKRLKSLRLEKDWTLAYLSRRSGISVSMLSDIEIGKREPSLATLEKIAAALDVDVRLLVGDPDLPGLTDPNLAEAFFRAQTMSPDIQKEILDFIRFQETRMLISKESIRKPDKE